MTTSLRMTELKTRLRAQLRQQRKDYRSMRGANLIEDFHALATFASKLASLTKKAPLVIAGYQASGNEISPHLLEEALAALGHTLVWPRVQDTQLIFCAADASPSFVKGAYGLLEPGSQASVLRPDLLIVPLLACDARGYRLGQGGGFYDRSLAALRATAQAQCLPNPVTVGLGFDCQMQQELPVEAHDIRLTAFLSPTQLRVFEPN